MLSSLFYIGLIKVMDDRSWMYRDSPQRLRMIDYCNRIQGFINYIISNPINISGGGSKCSCKRCKNKKFFDPDIVTMHFLQKKGSLSNTCVGMHTENHMFLMRSR
jgi:hypothetical protein